MAFFVVKTDDETIRDFSGTGNSSYLNKSGMYDVIIKAVIVDQTAKGSQHLNLWLEYDGKEQPIYQAIRLTNNDGSANLGAKLFNKLCVIAGGTSGFEVADPTPRMIPMGKGGEMKECMVLEEFTDLPVTINLRMEYSMWNGNIQENKNILNFFRNPDHATAQEIVNDAEDKGAQYEKEAEYADRVIYKDELTAEDIEEWIKNRRSGAKKEETDKKPAAGFGAKRTFGRKV